MQLSDEYSGDATLVYGNIEKRCRKCCYLAGGWTMYLCVILINSVSVRLTQCGEHWHNIFRPRYEVYTGIKFIVLLSCDT